MKTMKSAFALKSVSSLLIAFVLILGSCSKTEDTAFSTQDNQAVSNDGTVEAQQDEVGDIAISAIASNDGAGRVETDDRVPSTCASVNVVPTDSNNPKNGGTITINFGTTGCTDSKGNTRKGIITITWSGRYLVAGSSHTISTDSYSINGVSISGTRTVTNVTTPNTNVPTWTISGSFTSKWPDNTTATRTVNRTRQLFVADSKVVISQTSGAANAASGTNRYGKTYSVQITTPLEYNISCVGTSKVYIPVKGVKVITADSKVYTVDFGTGTCDNTFTVTFNGKSKEFTAKNDSTND